MRRIYFLVPDLAATRTIVKEAMVCEHHPEAEFERVGARVLDGPLP